MAFRRDLDVLMLSVLQAEALHGSEIARRIDARGETAFRTKEGRIYPILYRMENTGMLQSDWIPQEGKPARKVYRLTESGRGRLGKLIEA